MFGEVPLHGCIGNPCYICNPRPQPPTTIVPGLLTLEMQIQMLTGEVCKLRGALEKLLSRMEGEDAGGI